GGGGVGATADADGLVIAAAALANPDWIDELACLDADGALRSLAADAKGLKVVAPGLRVATAGSRAVELARARDIAMTLRGLFVRAALEADHGTWMIRAAAAEPDVVRVELRPGAREKPEAVLRAHAA